MPSRPHLPAAAPAVPATIDDALSGFALLLVVPGAMALLQRTGVAWDLADGVLFVALWWFAPRSWAWLLAAPLLARLFGTVIEHGGDPTAWIMALPDIGAIAPHGLLVAAGPLLLHHRGVRLGDRPTFPRIALLMIATGVSSIALSLYGYLLTAPVPAPAWPDAIAQVAGGGVLQVIGTLVAASVATWLAGAENREGSLPILRAVLLWLVPAVAVYLVPAVLDPHAELADLLRRLLAVGVILLAVRHGWRGGAAGMLLVVLAVAMELRFGGVGAGSEFTMRLYVAITCVVALLFGATTDDLRRHAAELTALHQEADRLAQELRVAAHRNLQAEERERRRLAGDLHDEFGQTLTAMQTHLKLAAPDLAAAGRGDTAQVLLRLAGSMRQQIGGILESLRPAALDELGLFAAIDRGPVRRMAEDAGLVFETHLEGDARLLAQLEPSRRIAAYRTVQEAVTNVVRHARATRCEVRIRASSRRRRLCLFLEVRDDGIGGVADFHRGHGLPAMRDRIIALGGRLHVRNRHPGLRVHAVILQGDPSVRAEGEADEDGVDRA